MSSAIIFVSLSCVCVCVSCDLLYFPYYSLIQFYFHEVQWLCYVNVLTFLKKISLPEIYNKYPAYMLIKLQAVGEQLTE